MRIPPLLLVLFTLLDASAFAQDRPPAKVADLRAGQREQLSLATSKIDGRYQGKWVTTWHKNLDGTTNCEIKQLTNDRWQGRFWGEWQRVPFDYTVEFAKSKPKKLKSPEGARRAHEVFVEGKAMIDGASYDWTGKLTVQNFDIQFTGSRYNGSLKLSRVEDKK
jgi:hypothetical protein